MTFIEKLPFCVCWKNLVMMSKILARSVRKIKDAQFPTINLLYRVFVTTDTLDSGIHTKSETTEMFRHPPSYSVDRPQSIRTSKGFPQVSAAGNDKNPKLTFQSSNSLLSASPTPCVFAFTSAVACPVALVSLSTDSESLLQFLSLKQKTS